MVASKSTKYEIWQFGVWRHKGHLKHFRDQLLLVDHWRRFYMKLRYIWLVLILGRLRTLDLKSQNVAKNTVMHNLKGLRDVSVVRSNALVRPLSMIESLDFNSKILTIGPRTEGELYNLAAHGFDLRNIEGVDLISYSKRIKLADMHNLPYRDNSWDAVVAGWVIAYSDNKQRAADEMIRVCRPGGIVAIGIEYAPLEARKQFEDAEGYTPGSEEVVADLENLKALFAGYIDHVYYAHRPADNKRDQLGSIVVIFSVKKDHRN